MKKLLSIFFVLCSLGTLAQYPATQTLGSDSTLIKSKGALQGRIINWRYSDTTQANNERISQYPYAQIVAGNRLYMRDSTATKWITPTASYASDVSIINDSSITVCNSGVCDTFTVHNKISSFTVINDSTIQVCGDTCDTIHINPTPIAKSYVDSVVIHNGATLDTLYYFINGNAVVGGYVGGRYYNKDQIDSIFTVTLQNYYSQTQIDSINTVNGVNNQSNRIISGGVVTHLSGLTYAISACSYLINGVVYNSPDTTITLDSADATNPRIDLFAVDTLNRALKITGIAASTPLTPQIDPTSQLELTTGITLEAGATSPTGTTSTLIYDENVEWTTGGTATINYNNTDNPYHGTKDALVSYSKNQTLTFSGTTQSVNGQTLRAFIRLNNANYDFQFQFFNGTTAVSNLLTLSGFGFNSTLYGTYQNVSIPLNAFTWSGTSFDKLVITMTGKGATGTYYLDYVSLESGTPVVSQIDYSNKVDQVLNRNDSIFYVIKGVYYYSGFNAYQRSQTDSITAKLRSEITSAAGGGVISFNGRNGAVNPDSTDYSSFYYLKHIVDSLLALKQNISDAFSGSYLDLTNKPVTVTNLSLGTATSTSQAINNSNGTGVTLPSASISIAGLMTAGDKTLVNTIPLKVAYADTSAMLSPYLRKADAFTKAQADLLYRPITWVPSWNDITGKPTFATVATTGSYTDLINTPTIPTNNNQLSNGAGYITSLDTMSLLHTYDSSLYVTPTRLKDTASAIRSSIPVQFNPIAGTGMTLSGTYPNITFNSSGSGSVTAVTATSPIVSSGGTAPNISLDTAKVHTSAYNNSIYALKTDSTITYAQNPIYAVGDTLKFKSDSLYVPLKYTGAAKDSANYDDSTLITKGYLNQRISAFVTTTTWTVSGSNVYYNIGNVLIGTNTDDGHTLRVNGTIEFNIGSDAAGDIFYRDSLGTFSRLAPPSGFTKPVLGFSGGYPQWQEDNSGGGGGASEVKQTYTGSTAVTIADSTTWLIINPASVSAAMTITMPANPPDKQTIQISFGGTVTSGNTVVTALTLSPNTGHTIIQASTPSTVSSGETITYKYNISNTSFYRIN